MEKRTLYTIFLGNELFLTCVDDMNTTATWATGGMLWKIRKQAKDCLENLKNPVYGIETENKKLKIVLIKL